MRVASGFGSNLQAPLVLVAQAQSCLQAIALLMGMGVYA
jgi:hypothetical protein